MDTVDSGDYFWLPLAIPRKHFHQEGQGLQLPTSVNCWFMWSIPSRALPFCPVIFLYPAKNHSPSRLRPLRGEFEPASFVLRAPSRDVTGLTLSPTDLYGSVGSTVIPSMDVDIKIVKPWFQSYYAWNELGKSSPMDFRQKLVPELLLKDDDLVTVDLNGGRNLFKLQRSGQPSYEWINQKTLAPTGQALPTMQEFPVKDAKTLQPFPFPEFRQTNLGHRVCASDHYS